MTTYKLKDDFVNGVLPNTGKPNILFKKGDVIQGEQITKFIFNANTKGIMSKPTVVGARVENSDGLVFVPLQNVEIITNVSDNGGVSKNQQGVKQLQSKEQLTNRINEEIAKIKFPLKTTVITSAVPLGLAYYSYYNNYSLTKGIGVVVIGSVVAWFGALTFSGGKFV